MMLTDFPIVNQLVARLEHVTNEAILAANEIDKLVDGPSGMPVDSIDNVRRYLRITNKAVAAMKEDLDKTLTPG